MTGQKIMLISHDANPEMVSGSEKALLMLGKAIQKFADEATWVSPRPGLSILRAKQVGMQTEEIPFPLLWSLIHDPNRITDDLQLLQASAENSQLERIIGEHNPDLIVTNSAINILPAIIARNKKIPLWWYIHEILPECDEVSVLRSAIFSYSNCILVPSSSVSNRLQVKKAEDSRDMNDEKKLEIIPYGVEIHDRHAIGEKRRQIRVHYGWSDQHVVAGWFGSIYQGKGLLDFIRAASYFTEGEKGIVFVAAGNVVDPGYLTLCMREANQMNNVSFHYLGAFPYIEDILPAADIVVIPSLVEEAFPNIALEAMAFGKSIIAYESGGLKELVISEETGLLVVKGDLVSLSSKMQDLIRNPEKREQMGMKGRECAVRLYRFELFENRLQKKIKSNNLE